MKKMIMLLPFAAVLLIIFLSVSAGKSEEEKWDEKTVSPDSVTEKVISVPALT